MEQHGNMAERTETRTVRLVAEELPGGLHVALWWYGHDDEGDSLDGGHLTATLQTPILETDVDHAWVVLTTALHMLEEAGSVGRIRHTPLSPPNR